MFLSKAPPGTLAPLLFFFARAGGAVDLKLVDPLIGTINGGHVFPGATLPYGMVKAVADTASVGENAAGFVSDDAPVLGFSHLHDSGTGGAASLGNFPIFVHPGCPEDDFAQCAYSPVARQALRVNGSVEAHPGYFKIALENGVQAEMTTTMHAALYRFKLPEAEHVEYKLHQVPTRVPSNPLVLLDVTDLSNTRRDGDVTVDDKKLRMTGRGVFTPSFGQGSYSAYFCADFKGAEVKHAGTFFGDTANKDIKTLLEMPRSIENPSGSAGGFFHFEHSAKQQIMARVGLSFISTEQACNNGEREIPDFDFAATRTAAEESWTDKLSAVDVTADNVSDELKKTFWSGMYRSFLLPVNYTGENPLWESQEPYFDSFYCIWDSFRAQHPLLTILDLPAQEEMVRALLDIYRNTNHLPDCRMSLSKGYTQGGANAAVVIADAWVKKIEGGIDWSTAYAAVVADAEIPPPDFSVEGRGNIESWEKYKYIAVDHTDKLSTGPATRSVSRTLEYAYNDYCISVLASGLDQQQDIERFRERSGYWKNVWNPDQEDVYVDEDGSENKTGFVGFPQPRLMSGVFSYQSTRTCSPVENMHKCYLDTSLSTYEGSPWLYSFYVPQDMAGLVDTMGGKEDFFQRLEYFHESGIVYMGNEPSFLTVFQFHYAGRPGKSSEWVHNYIPSQFNASINGIPGNDDCAMGAFSSMAMMGFFPVAGQDVYLLTRPFFPEIRFQGQGAVIRRHGDDDAYYIQSVKVNGNEYTKNWIGHEFFAEGWEMDITVGSEESDWGTRDEDLPPSHPPTG